MNAKMTAVNACVTVGALLAFSTGGFAQSIPINLSNQKSLSAVSDSIKSAQQQQPATMFGIRAFPGLKAAVPEERDSTKKLKTAAFFRNVFTPDLLETATAAESYFSGSRNSFIALSSDGKSRSLFTDIISDYLKLGDLGYGKFGLGALITDSDDNAKDTSNTAIQKFFSNGGNATVYLSLPFKSIGNSMNFFRMDALFFPKLSLDLPQLDSSIEDPLWNLDLGVEVYFTKITHKKEMILYTNFRIANVWGHRTFLENLGQSGNFAYTRLTMGLELRNMIRISGTLDPGILAVKKIHPKTLLSVTLVSK